MQWPAFSKWAQEWAGLSTTCQALPALLHPHLPGVWVLIHVGGFWNSLSGCVGESRHLLQTPLVWGPQAGVSHRAGIAALSVGSSHDRRYCCAGHLAVGSATEMGIKYIFKGRRWFFLFCFLLFLFLQWGSVPHDTNNRNAPGNKYSDTSVSICQRIYFILCFMT